jgi:hypothetical protein
VPLLCRSEAASQLQFPTCKILLFSGQAVIVDLLGDARTQGHQFDLLLKPVPSD